MKKLFIATGLAIMSVSVWGQSVLSPYTRHYVEQIRSEQATDSPKRGNAALLKKSNARGELVISAFIHLNEGYTPDLLIPYGVDVRTVVGSILTADIPLETLDEVAALAGVKYIEMGAPITQKLDLARKDTRVDEVQAGTSLTEGYTGKGVVIGIVDNGFDLGHPNFYTSDKSELRIKRLWDQVGSGTAPEGFGYGCEYTTAEAILAKECDATTSTHGTHVVGIAAGADNTGEKGLYGVAPDAEIVLVALDATEMYNGDNTAVLDGIKYIFDYADSVDKPCVVNLSLGSWLGPRDGTSTFDTMADALQGSGRLLVGSAGNDGGEKYHASMSFAGGEPDTLATFFNFTYRGQQSGTAEVWCDAGMDVTFVPFVYNVAENKIQKIYDPARFSATQCENKTYGFSTDVDHVWGSLSVEGEINPLNGKTHLMLAADFYGLNEGYDRGFYIISSNEGTVHMWSDGYMCSFSNFERQGYIDGNAQSSMGEVGGSGKRIISVGAYVSRDQYTQMGIPTFSGETLDAIASFSSMGPTADGRIKPDITAPGTYIISSLSSHYTGNKLKYTTVTWNDKKYEFGFMQGTSMAAPFVAGVMATWLQAYPNLTPEQAREILQKTARQDDFTGTIAEPSNIWGYGKIDAYEGIKECIRYESAVEPNRADNLSHLAVCDGSRVRVLFGYADNRVALQLYNLQGSCIATRSIDRVVAGEEAELELDGTAAGIYVLSIAGENTKSMVKKIIVQ